MVLGWGEESGEARITREGNRRGSEIERRVGKRGEMIACKRDEGGEGCK